MITRDPNLDITCGAEFLSYDVTTIGWSWTGDPKRADVYTSDRVVEILVVKLRMGELASGRDGYLPAEPSAEIIPAMGQNADGEWVDGEWPAEVAS